MAIKDGGLLLGAVLSTGGGQRGTSTSQDRVDGSLGQISAVSNLVHTSAVLYYVEEGQVSMDTYSVELSARDDVEDGQVGMEVYLVELSTRDAVVNAVDVGIGVLAVTYVVPPEVDKNTSVCSRRDLTAENVMMALMPRDFMVAMFSPAGMEPGGGQEGMPCTISCDKCEATASTYR